MTTLILPSILSVDLTNRCNLSCSYCRDIHNNKLREISESEMSNIILKMIDHIPSLEWIKLSGGEPLLYKSLDELVNNLFNKGKNTILQTNGILLNKKRLDLLQKAGLTKIQISIDGSENVNNILRGDNTYQAILRAIECCSNQAQVFQLKCTLSQINKSQIEFLFKIAKKYNAEKLNFRFFLPVGKAQSINDRLNIPVPERKKIIDDIHNLSIKYKIEVVTGDPCSYLYLFETKRGIIIKDFEGACTIGTKSIHISSDGFFRPCSMIYLNLGDTKTDDFLNVWKNNKFLNTCRDRQFKKCGKCKNNKKCGGCRVVSHFESDDYFQEDTSCFLN